MEHYRCHNAYIPKTISERISDTVDPPPTKSNMPKMSSTDATIHAAHDLIHSLQNSESESPPVTLENTHKESLRSLSGIFVKATSPAVPPRVPARGSY